MRSARLFCILIGLAVLLACSAQAADFNGYLLDKMCSAKAVKEGVKAAQAHTRECALMPECVKAGYGIFTNDGKFITFDPAGNKKAEQALKASRKKDNLRVQVTGELAGDTLKVQTLKLL